MIFGGGRGERVGGGQKVGAANIHRIAEYNSFSML